MSGHTNQDFVRGNPADQLRLLYRVGAVVLVVVAAIAAVLAWAIPRAKEPQGMPVSIVVPALGTGVERGTKVVLHGLEVGEVVNIGARSNGTIELDLVLRETELISDSFTVDFRPDNYFGTTAVNVITNPGGNGLVSGRTYVRTQAPDFSMSAMLTNGALVVDGTLTRQIIDSLDKVMRYADGLSPLIHTAVILADSVAKTQQQLPTATLAKLNDVLAVLPAFGREALGGLKLVYETPFNVRPDGTRGVNESLMDQADAFLQASAGNLFGQMGALLKSHASELPGLTDTIAVGLQPIPGMVGGSATMDELIAAIDGARRAFTGPRGSQTLQIRLVMESLPALQAPLAKVAPPASTKTKPTGGAR